MSRGVLIRADISVPDSSIRQSQKLDSDSTMCHLFDQDAGRGETNIDPVGSGVVTRTETMLPSASTLTAIACRVHCTLIATISPNTTAASRTTEVGNGSRSQELRSNRRAARGAAERGARTASVREAKWMWSTRQVWPFGVVMPTSWCTIAREVCKADTVDDPVNQW